MSNPLFGMMQNQAPANGMMQKFQQFRQMFRGDPRQQVQQMLSSGRITQEQYNQAVNTANQLARMMGIR